MRRVLWAETHDSEWSRSASEVEVDEEPSLVEVAVAVLLNQ
jgi:hypothetical protein